MDKLNIVCFSFDPWTSFWKRKQKLLFLSSKNPNVAKVIYVESPRRLFDLTDSIKKLFLHNENRDFWKRGILRKLTPITENFSLFSPVLFLPFTRSSKFFYSLSVKYFLRIVRRHINKAGITKYILWLYHPKQLEYIRKLPPSALIVYDWTDDWVLSDANLNEKEKNSLVLLQDELLKKAGLVLTVSSELYNRAKKENPHTYLVPNGTNFSLFSTAALSTTLVPDDIRKIKAPIIGYTGQITSRVDFELVKFLARERGEWSFIFIGPIFGAEANKEVVGKFKDMHNIYFLGPKNQSVLPGYMKAFNVCIVPHKVDALTDSMNPIKIYDYFAAGKPIVTTNIAGVEKFSSIISIANNGNDFLQKIEKCLQDSSEELIHKRQAIAKENSWEIRLTQIFDILKQQLS